jgi:ADP-L-glycero-D-manno-heptose 6-epimerase
MKILITGSSGFIGKNMVKALESKHDVFTYDWHQTYPDLDNLDWVIHLGAISSTTENRIHYILRQNLESSIYLYEDCINRNINFQFASSASVYGLQSGFKETCPLKPLNHYAISKAMFERYVELRNAPITTQIFRYFNVYGPDEEHKGNQASPQTKFLIQAKQNKTINIFEGSDKFKRDFIHVDKIVD